MSVIQIPPNPIIWLINNFWWGFKQNCKNKTNWWKTVFSGKLVSNQDLLMFEELTIEVWFCVNYNSGSWGEFQNVFWMLASTQHLFGHLSFEILLHWKLPLKYLSNWKLKSWKLFDMDSLPFEYFLSSETQA